MRTVRTVKGGQSDKLEEYYTEDESLKSEEYYSTKSTERVTTAQWMGSKATELGLVGGVTKGKFKKLFYGKLPDGERIRAVPKTGTENLAVDMTLSAPKSFSLHALDDLKLFDAHMEACKRTLEAAERFYCLQRTYDADGARINVMADGFIAAAIPHWTSREQDAQLHSHVLIFNGCQGPDGVWRAFDDRQFSRSEWVGSFYRNELARLTQALGYSIHEERMSDGSYSFEIDGLTREQIESFSKRTAQVEAAKAAGVSKDKAAVSTRKAKDSDKNWLEFRNQSRDEMKAVGIELQQPQSRPVAAIGEQDAAAAVERAILALSTRSVQFSRDDIFKHCLGHMQRFELHDIESAIAVHPKLIDYGVIRKAPELIGNFTTAYALEREARTIAAWHQGKAIPILERTQASAELNRLEVAAERPLNSGQRSAVLGALSTQTQNLIIHGLSGVGKTTALRAFKTLADAQGVETLWFAPSIEAAKKLGQSVGADATTLQRLVYTDAITIKPGQVLMIDEAALSSAEMLDILTQKTNGARVVLIGDTGQNQPIDAGSPMRSLMKNGAEVYSISDILRQQNSVQKRAVELIAAGNGSDALALLSEHGHVTEIAERPERTQQIAAEFLALSAEQQAETLIVAGTNAEKDAIAAEIRAGLKASGALGASLTVQQLRDKGWNYEDAKELRNYAAGDFIALAKDYKKSALERGQLYEVVAVSDNLLTLNANGKTIELDPRDCYAKRVYSSQSFDVAVGDSLRWTATNRDKRQINGETFIVTAIEGSKATITDAEGKTRKLGLSQPLAVDYTLTTTSYRAQGSDRPRVFVSATNDPTSNREPFYVSISRQIHELRVWTEDAAGLARRVEVSSIQSNPLELLGVTTNDGHRNEQPHRGPVEQNRAGNHRQQYDDSANPRHSAKAAHALDRGHRPGPEHDSLRQTRRAAEQREAEIGHRGTAQGIDGRHRAEHGGQLGDPEQSRRASHAAENLKQLAAKIHQHRIEEALIEPLEQLRARLDPQALQTAKVEALAGAISAWRETRAIGNEAQLISMAQQVQSLQESRALGTALNHVQLSNAVQSYRAEAAISHALEHIRLETLTPDPLIMAGIDLILRSGHQESGATVLEGQTWRFVRTGDHVVITEQSTGKTAYEVQGDRVKCDAGAEPLAERIEQLRSEAREILSTQKTATTETRTVVRRR